MLDVIKECYQRLDYVILPFLWIVRLILEAPAKYHEVSWWWGPKVLASDGIVVSKGVNITRSIRYGPLKMQTMDCIERQERGNGEGSSTKREKVSADTVDVMYMHGGGFVACRSEHTSHSSVPFVRGVQKISRAYSVDYPYAPENRFPIPVLSLLQAAAHLYEKRGVRKLLVTGESSGGNLATVIAALIANRQTLLRPLLDAVHATCDAKCVRVATEPFDLRKCMFPDVVGVVSVCGILDREAWRRPFYPLPEHALKDDSRNFFKRVEWIALQCAVQFSLSFYQYKSWRSDSKNIPSALRADTLLGLYDTGGLHAYPKTFLVVAEHDPLRESSRAVCDRWRRDIGYKTNQRRGKLEEIKFAIFKDQHHAFFGLPMQWTDPEYVLQYVTFLIPECLRRRLWRKREGTTGAQLATKAIVQFLREVVGDSGL
eukprot:g3051.t1